MLRIRFFRTGKRNQPFFRIVVTDKKNPPRGGRFLEVLGFFNPQTKEKNLKAERIKHWLSVGAQPSDRVHNLLIEEKIIEGKKAPVHAKAKKKKQETTLSQGKPAEKAPEPPKTEEKPEEKPEPPKQPNEKPEQKEPENPVKAEPKQEEKPEPPKQLEPKETPKLEAPEPEEAEKKPKEEKPKE